MSDLKLDEFQPTPEASTPADGLERSAADLAAVYDVPVHIQAVLGRANVEVASLLRLNRGSVIELDRKVGEPIDIYVNNRLVARGEVVDLVDPSGTVLARGLSNYASEQVEQIKGLKTAEVRTKIGSGAYDEVVHRDNLVVVASGK